MAEHVLKCNAEYYDAIADGRKNFEVRRDDRGFQCGDVLILRPVDKYGIFIGSGSIRRRITYILTGGQFGIEPGYVVMGLADG